MTLQQDDTSDTDSVDSNDEYMKMIQFQSIRNSHGLEEAISVQWQNNTTASNALTLSKRLHISTILQQDDLAPLFDGAGWAGTRVWHAAIAAIQYLVQNSLVSSSTNLLELGCGLGVPGMVLHSLYGCNVCLTDQESILSQLQHNVHANFESSSSSSKIVARPLSWSRREIQQLISVRETDFDVVLNCDCVYEPLYGDSWKLLVECLDELLKQNSKTIAVTSVERRNADQIDFFLNALQESPHVSTVTKAWEDVDYRIEIYVARGFE
jgi:predicted nicotinamide N-methyase